jgi:hypothetical protein
MVSYFKRGLWRNGVVQQGSICYNLDIKSAEIRTPSPTVGFLFQARVKYSAWLPGHKRLGFPETEIEGHLFITREILSNFCCFGGDALGGKQDRLGEKSEPS